MAISEKIQQIIDHRQGRGQYVGLGHLTVIEKQESFFEKLKQVLIDFENFRQTVLSQISSKHGEYFQMSIEDPGFTDRVKAADPSAVLLKVKDCLEQCKYLKHRFGRDTINISVIGRARQGKSLLLQSISDVDNTIIPADDAGDCTGTTSEICNDPGEIHAKIEFYSDTEMVEQVQAYLDHLHTNQTLGSAAQIPSLASCLKELDNRTNLTAEEKSWKAQLQKYIKHYNEYAPSLGTSVVENDAKKIRSYVAQYTIDGIKTFRYLAVKKARIYTPFPFDEAGKIILVDTIGLGDTALGIEDKMLDTLKNDSDAAILVRLPAHTGDNIRTEDDKLYDLIANKIGSEMLDKWLFFALNVCDFLGNKKSGDTMYEAIRDKSLHIADLIKVNCGDPSEVRERLIIPMLEYLSINLKEVDTNLMKKANEIFAIAFTEYYSLCSRAANVINGGLARNPKAEQLFDQLWNKQLQLGHSLNTLEAKYKAPQKCQRILDEITKITRKLYISCPEQEVIQRELESGMQGSQTQSVYNQTASAMRADMIERFEEINHSLITALQEEIKEEIIEVLRSDNGGRLGRIYLNSEDANCTPQQWLSALISEKLSEHDEIREAFKNILDYRLNIEGLLEYRVNCALTCIDPYSDDFCQLTIRPSLTAQQQAEQIEKALLCTITTIGEKILNNIGDLLLIPYNSFYARVRKLHDRLFFLDAGKDDLKEFYRENRNVIWNEEFSSIVEKQMVLGEWNEKNEILKSLRDKSMFIIKL